MLFGTDWSGCLADWLSGCLAVLGLPRDRSHSTIPGKVSAGWHTAEVPLPDPFPAAGAADRRLSRLLTAPGRRDRLTHVERVPARAGRPVGWPAWAHPDLVQARVATRADGTMVGIRKPLAAHEAPIVRTYLAVEDIQRAAATSHY